MLVPDADDKEVTISSTMTQQINLLKQAVRNANAASSMIQLAESASLRVATDLTTMHTLAIRSTNSDIDADQRRLLNDEFQELIDAIALVTRHTQWRGKLLLDGRSYPHGIKFQLDGLPEDGIELSFGNLTHNSIASLFGTALSSLNIEGAAATSTWRQRRATLPVDDPDEQLTLASLGSDATTVAAYVTAESDRENHRRVRVFDWVDNHWRQRGGNIFTDETAQSASHYSIIDADLNSDGNSLCIAELRFERSGLNSWWTGVFDWDGTLWIQRGDALDDDDTGTDITGIKLSSDGDTLIVSSRPQDYSLEDPDQSKVFDWNGSQWLQCGSDLPGAPTGQQTLTRMNDLGTIVAMLTTSPQIAIFMLIWDGSHWNQQGTEIPVNYKGEFGCVTAISSDGNTVAFRVLGIDDQRHNFDEICAFRWHDFDWQQLGSGITVAAPASTNDAIALSSDGATVSYAVLGENQQTMQVYASDWNGHIWVERSDVLSIELSSELAIDPSSNSGSTLLMNACGSTLAISATASGDDNHRQIAMYDHALDTQRVIDALDIAVQAITRHTEQHSIAIEKLDGISQELTDTVITAESASNRILSTSDASKTTEITRAQITEQAVMARMTQANQQVEQVKELLKQL